MDRAELAAVGVDGGRDREHCLGVAPVLVDGDLADDGAGLAPDAWVRGLAGSSIHSLPLRTYL